MYIIRDNSSNQFINEHFDIKNINNEFCIRYLILDLYILSFEVKLCRGRNTEEAD